jgi:hypothetical protein
MLIFFGFVIGLGAAIALPILAAKGNGYRGLWFGLSIPALLLVLVLGSMPVYTFEQTKKETGRPDLRRDEYELMKDMDPAGIWLFGGAFLGCLIGGCVYRAKK